jgi:lipopolysaccharide export LptBFGC system permease protein LptF
MKQSYLALLLTALSFLFSSTINAQPEEEKQKVPKWVSEKGYWVVESSKKTPENAIVYFYSNENILVYREEIRDQKLKLNRKKTLLRLKAALEEVINRHEKGTWAANQTDLITQHLQQ